MKRGWIWLVVLASLALNLFLGGLIAGRWLGGKPPGGLRATAPTDIVMPFNPRNFLRSLPDERRREVHRFIRSRTAEIRRAFQAVPGTRKEVIAALEAEPFDAARLAAAFKGTGDGFSKAISAMHGVLTDLAGELSADERKLMADAIRNKTRQRAAQRNKRREERKNRRDKQKRE